MKRPLAVIGFTLLISMLFAYAVGRDYILYISIAVCFLFFISLFISKLKMIKAVRLTLFSAVLAFIIFSVFTAAFIDPAAALCENTAVVTARLSDTPYERYSKFYYRFSSTSVNTADNSDLPQSINFLLCSESPIDVSYNDSITVELEFSPLDEDEKINNYSHGIYIKAQQASDSYTINSSCVNDITAFILNFKANLTQRLYEAMNFKHASLSNAILLGDKNALEYNIKSDFYDIGVSHLVVVSGLHMSVITAFIFRIVYLFKRNRKFASVISVFSVICFMLITGFSASVVRSGIMLIILLSGELFNRRADSINSIGFAAIILCCTNPYTVLDVGLLLSFSSTLSILLFYEDAKLFLCRKLFYKKKLSLILNYILSVIILSLCATGAAFPITLFFFGSFSPYFLLSNLLLVFAAELLLMCLLPAVIFSFIPFLTALGELFFFISGIICEYMISIADFIGRLPFANIDIDLPFMWLWLVLSAIIISAFFIHTRAKASLKYSLPCCLALIIILFSVSAVINKGNAYITFLNCGNGVSALLTCDSSCAVLSCGGSYSSDNIDEFLESYDIIDLEVIYGRKTNSAYAENILYNKTVSSVIIPDDKIKDGIYTLAKHRQDNVFTFGKRQDLSLWNSVEISLLYTDNALWQYIRADKYSFLIAPSNGSFAEIPEEWLKADYTVINRETEDMDLIESENLIICNTKKNIDKFENSDLYSSKVLFSTMEESIRIKIN